MTNPLDDIEDMGFLAEDACRQLTSAIVDATQPGSAREKYERVNRQLRRFMQEAKKGRNVA